MLRQNLFKILLLSLVLGQNCLAKPTNNEIDKQSTASSDLCHYHSTYKVMQPSEKDSQLAPTVQLLKITISGLMDMSITYAEKAKHISDQILNTPEIVNLSDNAEEVKDFKQKLLQFEESYGKCENIKQLFEMVEFFSITTSTFYEQAADAGKLSENGKIILKILKEYDTHKIEEEFVAEFNKFVTKFEEKYANLEEALNKENNDLVQKIRQWHKEFKTLKTFDDRIEALAKFTELYGMNETKKA